MSSESSTATTVTLDACGLYCPEPVMLLHKKFREIVEGTEVVVLATDPSTSRDIPKFCLFLGHELLSSDNDGSVYRYRIRKKAS